MTYHHKIGIDAFPLNGNLTGIGRYVLEICQRFEQYLEGEFFLYTPNSLKISFPSKQYHIRIVGDRFANILSSHVWLKLIVGKAAMRDGINVFWSPRTLLPRCHTGIRTVSTIHDFNYTLYPDSMPKITNLAHRAWFYKDIIRSNKIITNSKATSEKLERLMGIRAAAIARPGVSTVFTPQNQEIVHFYKQKLKIKSPFFLTVATLEPRKNLKTLLQSFITMKKNGLLSDHTLLIVGKKGWRNREELNLINQAERFDVKWLGFVDDKALSALYSGTTALVFPSLYEGFGMPVAEARACGAKILATDIPEIREASGNQGIFISPTIEGLTQGLLEILQSPQLPPTVVANWETSAQVIASQIKHLSH